MLVESPAPGVAAEWHHALNVAAAKLAVAAGIAPAEVRRVSGLHRVEIRKTRKQILRQTDALARAAVLTSEDIAEALISGVDVAQRIETGQNADELGAQYLAICGRARHYERLHTYFDQTEAFSREYTAVANEFYRCQKKIEDLQQEYDLIGNQLAELASRAINSMSWPARRACQDQTDDLVRRRDTLRSVFARTCQETGQVMEQFRLHHAKRVYYHSRDIPEFRDEALVFVPSSTLRKMLVCPFEEVKQGPALREKALRLMREWNSYCEEFATTKRTIFLEHKADEFQDHTMRTLFVRPSGDTRATP
ncbi:MULTISPECIES: hypothetical protein [Mycobacteriaceae]|uniref:hypothetical protein n=1 Tax=Mycobacteriaceae TaxID=1762 RepID=UPI00074006C9|nr:hypothetical protein [Mycobacterium sp. IS-1742]KUI24057.1 hypothetical protein AU196_09905 [Mycobacterium sp. IS-1742]